MNVPEYSVVLETDNRAVLETGTLQRVLSRVHADGEVLGRPGELLVVHDPSRIPSDALWQAIGNSGFAPGGAVEVELVVAPGARYYQAKNIGARRSRGEIVIFLDSDTVPEPGWLGHMLSPFADPAVDVLGGSTRTPPGPDLYRKTFALFWAFPLRPTAGPIREVATIHANGFAARRPVFERYPFPDDRRYRGQCATLARTLTNAGITVWRTPCAVTEHPVPRGYTLRRALWRGHDLFFAPERAADPRRWRLTWSFRLLASAAKGSATRIIAGRRLVGLSVVQLPGALAIAFTYDLFTWLGFVLTRYRPNFLPHHFPV